jgi:hypothetical protein
MYVKIQRLMNMARQPSFMSRMFTSFGVRYANTESRSASNRSRRVNGIFLLEFEIMFKTYLLESFGQAIWITGEKSFYDLTYFTWLTRFRARLPSAGTALCFSRKCSPNPLIVSYSLFQTTHLCILTFFKFFERSFFVGHWYFVRTSSNFVLSFKRAATCLRRNSLWITS